MHSSPNNSAKGLFEDSRRLTVYFFGILSTLCVVAGNVLFISYTPGVWPYALFVGITVIYLGMSYLVGIAGSDFQKFRHESLIAKWFDKASDARVDIYLPICGEDREIIYNTWEHVRNLASMHPGCEVYVLDDKPTEEAKRVALGFGFYYLTRPSNELKKAGNLRAAFKRTTGDFIVIFDADFCPRTDFLIETLPYMFQDAKVAIVQTPQFFDHDPKAGWIANAAGAVQELFYRLIQVNRDSFGGAICVGTNAVYRREALAPFGGTAPMAYSEDVHTGFQVLCSGWKVKYIPRILAQGVCPDTLQQFFTQQYRWAMGSISLFFSKKFWAAPITKMQRVCFLTGMGFYISTGVSVFLTPIPGIVMLLWFPEKVFWYNLLLSVPSLLYGTIFMGLWMRLPMGLDVLRIRQVSYYAHIYALRDFLLGTLEEWKPTGAAASSQRFKAFKATFTVWTILSLNIPLGLIMMRVLEGYNPLNFALMLAFVLFNMLVQFPILEDM